ncbi:amino acid adenylation domain-containing protein [Catenuloplanes nepalensis]|uniref:Amino acid adenylation domain-containing protein n=1 Tax=Catenuloplanes nepalensis TaxID=587533 RepID=A0ABT9MQT7_9ACTN|nr:non-ribosomal peptide synthetase [Catenuloplanes nepalensis]MDP9793793.1 amino acid adenylation domain-containing protein [Catenuloplanes nepalensis]
MTVETLPEAVRRWAGTHPDALAVDAGDSVLTYRQLAARAAGLAVRLRAAGAGAETIVGLATGRTPDLVTGLLGILEAGAAWVPLDPAYPDDRLSFVLRDSAARLVVADAGTASLPALADVSVLVPADTTGEPEAPPAPPDPRRLAYVLYTSGSTGRPKGVMVTEGCLGNLGTVLVDAFRTGPGDRILQFASPSFDASVWEIGLALRGGATLVLAGRAELMPGPALAATLRDRRITHAVMPPSVLAELPPVALPDLRELVCGGEVLSRPLAARWAAGRRLVNGYGPTETTVCVTMSDVAPDGGAPTIGRAFGGASVHLVGPDLRPVADGQPGEIAVGGARVSRGYLGRAALTAHRFVPDPFGGPPGARLYLTGDLGRRLPSGEIEFLGRADQQIKWRGFRIEPDEIAAVLREHPRVRDALVVLRDDHLTAYVTAADVTSAALRDLLAARLPAHMLPSAIVPLDRMPLTAAGKVDRAALPAAARADSGLGERVPPRTATEHTIVAIMARLLGGADVGVTDGFFALGGHSLLAARLIARVRDATGLELPASVVFAGPSATEIAAYLDSGAAEPALPPLRPVPRDRPLPLSFPQERVWYIETAAPGNLAYNAQFTVRLRGPLDQAVLAATLAALVDRHEVLRTAFVTVDGLPVQRPQRSAPARLPFTDLSGLPGPEREARAAQVIADAVREPFDLARPPLARWTLIRHDTADHTLVQVEHHFVHDGWSQSVFLSDLETVYPALLAGEPVPPPAHTAQFADFAVWQREWMRGPVLDRHLDYWTARLAGVTTTVDLPADRPRPAVPSMRGDLLRIDLPDELARALRGFARAHGVTLFTTMLAGFAALLHRYSRQRTVVVGTAVADRRLAESERLIGMLVNTLPLVTDLGDRPGFGALVQRVHETALDAYAWQAVPLDRLVRALAPVRDPSRDPLFSVLFSAHDSPVPDLEFGGLRGEVVERHNGSAKMDLSVVVVPRAEQRAGRPPRPGDDRITLLWEYATDLFEADTMRRMAGHYLTLLAEAVRAPHTPVARLPLGPAVPAAPAIPAAPAVSVGSRAVFRPAHEQVADAARASAGTPVCGTTYGELDAAANALAHRLVRAGAGPDVPVVVCAGRGAESILGQLAALKAGAAFLPVDAGYPAARLAYLIRDSRAPVLLATPEVLDRLPATTATVLPLDLSGRAGTGPAVRVSAHHLAYVVYTSGSTGRPKGVAITHGSLANLIDWYRDELGLTADDTGTLVASPGFDGAIGELWPALATGAAIACPSDEVRATPAALTRWFARAAVTVAYLPTVLAGLVLAEPWPASARLRVLSCGGEALTARPAPDAPFRLVNLYGPAENTVNSTAGTVRARPAGRPSIGVPIRGAIAYVLDEDGTPAPVGVPGELYVTGAGLARGYLHRPGLTADRFLPDPFSTTPGARMYRTGDLARWRPDGELDFLGRTDEQVKILGFRIETAEVSAVLREHDHVRDALVVARDDPGRPRRLVAYLEAGETHAAALRVWLRDRLPAYMIPADLVFLSRLPRTTHGKIDRDALPAPVTGPVEHAPGTPAERRIAALAEPLLGRPIGAEENFFAAGGHSLLAARLVARAGAEFGVDVPLRRFLAEPTVRALATVVGEATPAVRIRPALARSAPQLLARLDELTDDEVAALLARLDDGEVSR